MKSLQFLQCFHIRCDADSEPVICLCNEMSDIVMVIVKDKDCKAHAFESEAHHLREWCKSRGFEIRHQVVEVEIENPFDLE